MANEVPDEFFYHVLSRYAPGKPAIESDDIDSGVGASVTRLGYNQNYLFKTKTNSTGNVTAAATIPSGASWSDTIRFRMRTCRASNNMEITLVYGGDESVTTGSTEDVEIEISDGVSSTDTFVYTIASGSETKLYSTPVSFTTDFTAWPEYRDITVRIRKDLTSPYAGVPQLWGAYLSDEIVLTDNIADDELSITSGTGNFVAADAADLKDSFPITTYHMKRMIKNLEYIQKNDKYQICSAVFSPAIGAYLADSAVTMLDTEAPWHNRLVKRIPVFPRRGTGYCSYHITVNPSSGTTRSIWLSSSLITDARLFNTKNEDGDLLKHWWPMNEGEGAGAIQDHRGGDELTLKGQCILGTDTSDDMNFMYDTSTVSSSDNIAETSSTQDTRIGTNTYIRSTGLDAGDWSYEFFAKKGTLTSTKTIIEVESGANNMLLIEITTTGTIRATFGGVAVLVSVGTVGSSWTNCAVKWDNSAGTLYTVVGGTSTSGARTATDMTGYVATSVKMLDGAADLDLKVSDMKIWYDFIATAETTSSIAAGRQYDPGSKDTEQVHTSTSGTLQTFSGSLKIPKSGRGYINLYAGRIGANLADFGGSDSGMIVTEFHAWEDDSP